MAAKKKKSASTSAKKAAAPRKSPSKAPAKSAAAPAAEGRWSAALAPRKAGERRYWLVKSEPSVFSFDSLMSAPDRRTFWDGVRNFAARNFLRDGMKIGDGVLFYHSMTDQQSIVGICTVVREGYPDPTAFDAKHPNYDVKSDRNVPTWFMVDIQAVERLSRPVTLHEIKQKKELADMVLLRIGRLSVSPVTPAEWRSILQLGASKAP